MGLTMQVTYADFPVLTPTKSDKAVGGVDLTGHLYCGTCIERYHLHWEDMKYITNSRARAYIYNCSKCGWRITSKRKTKYNPIV